MRLRLGTTVFLASLLVTAAAFAADAPLQLGVDVKEHRLENGMLILVLERPATPQVACRLAIRAGSALEVSGKTGIAHMLEHMMFKGTKNFGTIDFVKDGELQAQIESAYEEIRREQQKRRPDEALIRRLKSDMDRLRAEVQKLYVPQAFSSQLGRNGAVGVNAFTTQDQTQYTAAVPSDMLEQWFSIVSEQLFEPAWREFFVEKEVVQREWAFRYINNPSGAAWLDLFATAYTAHPYRNPVIGWKSDMQTWSTQDAIDFHRTYYNPANAVLVLVGDVTMTEAKRLAEIYFARYPSGQRSPETVTVEPPQQGPRSSIRFLKGARTPLVRIGFHGAPMGTDDFFALDALTMVLSYGRGARLTQNVVNRGLAVDAWAYNPDNRYGGMLILGGEPSEPDGMDAPSLTDADRKAAYQVACEKLEALLLAEIEKLKTELVSDRELARVKKLNRRDFLERLRSNESMAGTLATLEVQIGWRYLTEYLQRFDAVTPEDIRRVAAQYVSDDNRTAVYVLPGGAPDKPAEVYTEVRSVSGTSAKAAPQTTYANHSIYPTPAGWRHPLSFERRPHRVTYPPAEQMAVSGATVFYLPDTELPLIDLTLLVKAGAVDLPAAKAGLTDILSGALISGGSATHPPSELAMLLDENGIQVSVAIDEEQAAVRMTLLRDDWRRGLSLLREILLAPGFDAQVLEAVKQQAMAAIQRQGDDAQAVAARESMIWHFSGHPYGRDPLAALDTIPSITPADMKEFLERFFVPANTTVAVSGDIEKAAVDAGLTEFFNAFPQTAAPGRRLDDPAPTPPVVALVHKPGQVQSQIVMLLPGVKRTNPDYWDISLLANVFGGSDSLLYRKLRDDLGLVYATYFYQSYKWQAGLLTGYIGCKGDRTAQAIDETVAIMRSLQREVPEDELEQKRLDVLNSFVFNVDTKADLVAVYGRYHMRQEPLDTLERIQTAYFDADRGMLRGLADRYLTPGRLQVFVVADKTIRVQRPGGDTVTLEENLQHLAADLGLPFKELPLR